MKRAIGATVTVGLLVASALAVSAQQAPVTPPAPAMAAAASAIDADVQALRQRAATFWAARLARDFRVQYDLYEPRFRGRMTPEEFAGGRGAVLYLGYQVEEATIDGAFGRVKVRVAAQPAAPALAGKRVPVQASLLDDAWVKVGGLWYRRADQPEGSTQQ